VRRAHDDDTEKEVRRMYSIVLAAMLTAGPAAPAWGCHGCCGGCYGGYNAFSHGCCGGCFGCCGGCYGGYYSSCYGCCGGCYGCCGGCFGSYAWPGTSWGGCWSSGAFGCCSGCCGGWNTTASWSGAGCCGGYSSPGWYSGCCGGVIYGPATGGTVAPPPMPKLPEPTPGARGAAPATVVVKAAADVKLTVNGQAIEHAAGETAFTTPDLQPDKTYSYEFQAEAVRDGKTVTRIEKVAVKPGKEARVDFGDLTAGAAAPAAADGPAHVTVTAPADATVTVDGVAVPAGSGDARSFDTPTLPAGRVFYYTIKMEIARDGRTATDSRRVLLEANKPARVDFSGPVVREVSR
jgi:uncharacterized protein (TIGR03000 family)